jgi:hypothetical protein
MQYHSLKMEEINKIIKELWVNTYCGSGIYRATLRTPLPPFLPKKRETKRNQKKGNLRTNTKTKEKKTYCG